jgi:hypothetical protein
MDISGSVAVAEDLAGRQSRRFTARRKASRAEPLRRLCETRSGAIATTMPAIRSNRPDGCCSVQARNSFRVMGVSGSWVWARAMA